MKVYERKPDHVKQAAGSGDLADFFAWALKLARRDEADRVMVETPDWRIVWTAKPQPLKKRIKQPIEKRRTKKAEKR